MATKQLTFTKGNDYDYSAKLDGYTSGDIIQVRMKDFGEIHVYANLPGLPPSYIRTLHNDQAFTVIFSLEVPEGLEITLHSSVEVTEAKWMQ